MRFDGERFNTLFMLGHNIGMCGTLGGIEGLLRRCEALLRPGGRLLVNSVKEPESPETPKGYPGELEFRLCYKGDKGPWMRWFHVDVDTLSRYAQACGWSLETLVDTEEGGFLDKLTRHEDLS